MLTVDYSFTRPSIDDLARRGYVGVLRYVGGSLGKRITAGEARTIRAARMAVGIVFESSAARPLAGAVAGSVDGRDAHAQATAVGFPVDLPIYFAADTYVAPAQYATVGAYLRAARAASGRRVQGIYGGAPLVQWCLDRGFAEFGWIASAASWSDVPSRGRPRAAVYADMKAKAPGAHLFQRIGAPVYGTDENEVLRVNWGAWLPDGASPTPAPFPEDEMETPHSKARRVFIDYLGREPESPETHNWAAALVEQGRIDELIALAADSDEGKALLNARRRDAGLSLI